MLKNFNCRPSPCKSHYLSRTTTAAPLPCRMFNAKAHSPFGRSGLGNPRLQQHNELLRIVGIQFSSFYADCICAAIPPAFSSRAVTKKYRSTASVTIFRCSPDTDHSDCCSPNPGLILISVTFTHIQSQPDSWLTYALLTCYVPCYLVSLTGQSVGDRRSDSRLMLANAYLYCCLYGRTLKVAWFPRYIHMMQSN
jgi:hypothetical protein